MAALNWLVFVAVTVASSALLMALGARVAGFTTLNTEEHWTVVARRYWPARRGVSMAGKVVPVAVGGVLGWQVENLPLAIAGAAAAYLGIALVALRMGRAIKPGFGWRDYLRSLQMGFVHRWSWLLVVLLFVPLCSDSFDRTTILVLTLGAFVLVLYFRHGVLVVERLLGLQESPPERLKQIVSAVSTRLGRSEPRVRVLSWSAVQAFAYMGADTITVSRGALECLSDAHLEAAVAHEIGHLQETPTKQLLLNLSGMPLIGLAAYFPIVEQYNVGVYVVTVIACWWAGGFVALSARGLDPKALEKRADEVAQGHVAPGIYAAALERVHQVHLVPVVLDHEDSPKHPSLYDRMKAAGVAPAYERPEPPSVNLRTLAVAFPLVGTVALVATAISAGFVR